MNTEFAVQTEEPRTLTRQDAILYGLMNLPGLAEVVGIAANHRTVSELANPIDFALLGWGAYALWETGKAVVEHFQASSLEP